MNRCKYYLLTTAFILSAIFFLLWSEPEELSTELYFSNTQTWDTEIESLKHREQKLLPDIKNTITLPNPPANDSTTTRLELAKLHKLEENRTPEQVKEIKTELLLETTVVAGELMTDLINPNTRPRTNLLFQRVLNDFDLSLIHI